MTNAHSGASASVNQGSATLYDLILPGTHDSAAYTANPYLPSRLTARTPLIWRPLRNLTATLATEFALTQTQSILQQLRSGVRFLDLRVTKIPSSFGIRQNHATRKGEQDTSTFWTHHGIVLCTPLQTVLDDINTFHSETTAAGNKTPIVMVFRNTLLSAAEEAALTQFICTRLWHDVYLGDAVRLRCTPVADLPHNIIAGLHGLKLGLDWGRDPWIDTYIATVKIEFLQNMLSSAMHRRLRNNLMVVGWTITPSIVDIVLRVVSFGTLRTPLLPKAVEFNAIFGSFCSSNFKALCSSANVIFFDAFTSDIANQVAYLNSLKQGESLQHEQIDSTRIPP